MSARTAIFADIKQRLLLIDGIGSVELMPSGDPDAFPALEIYDHGQAIVEAEAGSTTYLLALTIEGFVVGGDGAQAHADLGDLYVAVVQALVPEPPIAGAKSVDEADLRVAVTKLADESRLGFALDLAIQFASPRGDPSRFA